MCASTIDHVTLTALAAAVRKAGLTHGDREGQRDCVALVALREPLARFRSGFRYYYEPIDVIGVPDHEWLVPHFGTRDNSQFADALRRSIENQQQHSGGEDDEQPPTSAARANYTVFPPSPGARSSSLASPLVAGRSGLEPMTMHLDDPVALARAVVLCIGAGHPSLTAQLRARFDDPRIGELTVENPTSDLFVARPVGYDVPSPDAERWLRDVYLAEDFRLYGRYCGAGMGGGGSANTSTGTAVGESG